jgi:hypothetical protein
MDLGQRILVIAPLPPTVDQSPVRIVVPNSARLKTGLPDAKRITDAAPFQFEDLKVGETVYVRGSRKDAGRKFEASLVLKGGYRGILGALVEVRALDSALLIQEFGTGRSLRLKVTSGELYRTTEKLTNPTRLETESGVVLVPIEFADLQVGDAVLIVGKTSGDGTEGDGLVAVTRFGTFGVLPQDPDNRISWLLGK